MIDIRSVRYSSELGSFDTNQNPASVTDGAEFKAVMTNSLRQTRSNDDRQSSRTPAEEGVNPSPVRHSRDEHKHRSTIDKKKSPDVDVPQATGFDAQSCSQDLGLQANIPQMGNVSVNVPGGQFFSGVSAQPAAGSADKLGEQSPLSYFDATVNSLTTQGFKNEISSMVAESGVQNQNLVKGDDFGSSMLMALEKAIELNTPVMPSTVAPIPAATVPASFLPSAANSIPSYFGSAGWTREVSQQVVWMVAGSDQSATFTLNPPDLGPLQVVIHVNNQTANATFISDNPDVRQALLDGVQVLRDMMGQSGIALGQANVSSQDRQQQSTSGQVGIGVASLRQSNLAKSLDTGTHADQVLVGQVMPILRGRVDTFA